MFYCLNLLIRQHGGKFCEAWLAATRGIQYIPKNKIVASNIVQICADILVMIETSSNTPSLRLSLSLSSRLINGTVKIHRRQVEIVLEEISKFLAHVQKPPSILEITELQPGTPDSPVPKKQRKRKRQVKITQENELEVLARGIRLTNEETVLELPLCNQADVDLITLREDLVTGTGRYDIGSGELGVFPDVEPFIQDVPFPSVRPIEDQTPKRAAEEEILPQTPSKRKRTSATLTEKPVAVPEILVLSPQVERENLVQVVADNQLENNHLQDIETVQEHIVPATEPIEPVRPVPKGSNKIDICIQRAPRFLAIDRRQDDEDFIFTSKMDNQHQLERAITLEDIDMASLVSEFMEATRTIEDILAASAGPRTSLVPSLGHSRGRVSKKSRSRSRSILQEVTPMPSLAEGEVASEITPHILVPIEVHAPHSPEVAAPLQLNEEKSVLIPLAESTPINFDVLENLPVPRTIEIIAPPVADNNVRHARKVLPFTSNDDDRSRRMQRKDRQRRIKNIVENWTEEGGITIEDVCNEPINRYNVAATFGDLLSLQAMGYVKLNSKPDSIELGTIEKGPKLLH